MEALTLDELVARERIRELVLAYNHHGDGGRLTEMVALFEPDATLDAFGEEFTGHDAILGFYTSLVDNRASSPGRTFVRHHVTNVSVEVERDGIARGHSYWAVFSDDGFESSGRYRDEYRGDATGAWRFSRRTIRKDEPRRPGADKGA
jgi:hypothetical protein